MKTISKIATIGFITALMLPASAMAQNFTFETKDTDNTQVGAPSAEGPSYYGSYSEGKSKTTNADGTTVKGTHKCVGMSQPPGIFKIHTVCSMETESGNFSAAFGCNPLNKEGTEMSCVGGMRGASGDYEGKTGSMTFHGKDDGGTGTGTWHD